MRNLALTLCLTSSLAAPASIAQERLEPPKPAAEPFEFSTEKGWPPEIKGIENVKVLDFERSTSVLTEGFVARLDEVALQTKAVRRVLGDRYAFVEASIIEESKEADTRPLEQQLARVVYYSYTRNVAVEATVRGGEVLQIRDLEGYQPPEHPAEVEIAMKLARTDPRIADLVKDLEGRGLATEMGEGMRGSGNRLIYVSFEKPGTANAEYFALVDMTEGAVLDAGPTTGRE